MAKGKIKSKVKKKSKAKEKPKPIASCSLSEKEAKRLFKELEKEKEIPFDYPDDCCYSRAHEMCRIMKEKGIESRKVWNYAHDYPHGNSLRVNTKNHPAGHVNWRYHVAPVVEVQGKDGKKKDMVMDPSMFDGPVTVEEWVNAQSDPTAEHEFSSNDYYFRGKGGSPKIEDPDYSKTKGRLKEHRDARDIRKKEAEEKEKKEAKEKDGSGGKK